MMCLLMIPLCTACNDTDDVEEIFTGKTWRLTFINDGKSYGWYHFPNVKGDDCMSYDPVEGKRIFTVNFKGTAHAGLIDGTFKAKGSVNLEGNWKANGKTNDFMTTVRSRNTTDPSDPLGEVIAEGLTNATSYTGDSQNLYLHYTYRHPKTGKFVELQMAFTAVK